jgi:hypothetical protein
MSDIEAISRENGVLRSASGRWLKIGHLAMAEKLTIRGLAGRHRGREQT